MLSPFRASHRVNRTPSGPPCPAIAKSTHFLARAETFRMAAAEEINWSRAPPCIFDHSGAPLYGWFSHAVCNTCCHAVDRGVAAGSGIAQRSSPLAGARAVPGFSTDSAARGVKETTGSSSTCRWWPTRWCRCWLSPARVIHSAVFVVLPRRGCESARTEGSRSRETGWRDG